MRLISSICVALLACTSAHAQPLTWAPDASIGSSLWAVPMQKPEQLPSPQKQWLSYTEASAKAARDRLPLVVFVGTNPRQVSGAIVCVAPALDGVSVPAVVVSLPNYQNGWLSWEATLPSNASDSDIRVAAGLEVRQLANPFSRLRRGELPRTADGDDAVGRRLAARLPFLSGMELYTTARYTQTSHDRNLTGRAYIASTDRTVLENKWLVPGGLDGVRGWRSRLFRGKDNQASYWVGPANPGELHSELTHQRVYGDGAIFADVLSNSDDEVFEVRVAEKNNGQWERYVAFRDVAARPQGYVSLTSRACVDCHSQANSGVYAGPRVPGGDTVLSDPVPRVESLQAGRPY